MTSSKQRHGRVCPVCLASPPVSDEDGAAHFRDHVVEGTVAVVEGVGCDWYIDRRTGLAVWRVPVEREDAAAEPLSTVVDRVPHRAIAAQSILVGLLPALLAGVVFWRLTSDQPFLPWAAGPCAFIIILRGVRRMAARVLLRRRIRRATLPQFAGEAMAVEAVPVGQWVEVAPGRVSRVIAVDDHDSDVIDLVFGNGATRPYRRTATVVAGVVASEGEAERRGPQRQP